MKLYLYYESAFKSDYTWLETDDEELSVMVENDYHQRQMAAEDPASVSPRDAQQIRNEDLTRPPYNPWHKPPRHCSSFEEYNVDEDALERLIVDLYFEKVGEAPMSARAAEGEALLN